MTDERYAAWLTGAEEWAASLPDEPTSRVRWWLSLAFAVCLCGIVWPFVLHEVDRIVICLTGWQNTEVRLLATTAIWVAVVGLVTVGWRVSWVTPKEYWQAIYREWRAEFDNRPKRD